MKVSDYYSGTVIESIFDPLLTYDYLARPAKLVPNTAESLPQITDNGKTYTLKLRKGIYFASDPAFKGKRRELTAEDYAYSIKRFFDPKNRSPYAFLFEGKIVGLDELGARAKKTDRFDYEARVPGLEVPDRYTLRIRLRETDFNFSHILAFPLTGAVAREAIEAYGDDINSHPVGTGPYLLGGQSRLSRQGVEFHPRRGPPRQGDRRADEGQEPPAHRNGGDQRGRGNAEPVARFRARRDGHRIPALGHLAHFHDRGRQAQARVREARHQARPQHRSRDHVHLFQHAGENRRPAESSGRLEQGENRLAPRHRDGVQDRRPDQDPPQGAGDQGRIPDSARHRRPRSKLQEQHPVRPADGQRAARQVRLQEGRGRLPRDARRQAARRPLFVNAVGARPPVRRADEALARFDRDSPGNPQGPLARAGQAAKAVSAHDARLGLDRRLPGRG
ncbi:MAG: hypothetical protein E6H75_14900 [Betaproteobacteria bacterium]|nr:MAG: hypothetical protein E6H75_14900 [Betaproteobacteria bacterium]